MHARIASLGAALPDAGPSNGDLERRLGLAPGWIAERTGVTGRRWADPETPVSALAIAAGRAALDGWNGEPPGLVILATSTPDHLLPPTAPAVAHVLGLACGAFDLAGSCSGFLLGLSAADAWARAHIRPVLLVAANVLTSRLDCDDPSTAPLFGDGAGACVVAPSPEPGIVAMELASDGALAGAFTVPAGGSARPVSAARAQDGEQFMRMAHGPALHRAAVTHMAALSRRVLAHAAREAQDVDLFVPHQASGRIIASAARRIGIPEGRTVNCLGRHGNTSAASIPLALHEAARDGRLRPGMTVLLAAAGAGLTAGAALLRWT